MTPVVTFTLSSSLIPPPTNASSDNSSLCFENNILDLLQDVFLNSQLVKLDQALEHGILPLPDDLVNADPGQHPNRLHHITDQERLLYVDIKFSSKIVKIESCTNVNELKTDEQLSSNVLDA